MALSWRQVIPVGGVSVLLVCTLMRAWRHNVQLAHPEVQLTAYVDDRTYWISHPEAPSKLRAAIDHARRLGQPLGWHPHPGKTTLAANNQTQRQRVELLC